MDSSKPKTTKPPKNREFLALVNDRNNVYWDIFFWATMENGVGSKGDIGYHDRMLFPMPKIAGWVDLPDIKLD